MCQLAEAREKYATLRRELRRMRRAQHRVEQCRPARIRRHWMTQMQATNLFRAANSIRADAIKARRAYYTLVEQLRGSAS